MKSQNRLKVEKAKHQFRNGDNCPFCDGKLYDKNKAGLLDNKIILKCDKDKCWFNKVDFEP